MEISYALIKNNIVENIIIFDSPTLDLLESFRNLHNADSIVIAENNVRIGSFYDGEKFINLSPFPSWIFNEQIEEWIPPIDYPEFNEENPKNYRWNEDILNWEEIQASE